MAGEANREHETAPDLHLCAFVRGGDGNNRPSRVVLCRPSFPARHPSSRAVHERVRPKPRPVTKDRVTDRCYNPYTSPGPAKEAGEPVDRINAAPEPSLLHHAGWNDDGAGPNPQGGSHCSSASPTGLDGSSSSPKRKHVSSTTTTSGPSTSCSA